MKALGDRWVAVGWLHPHHPFPTGTAPPDFVSRLTAFARNWGKNIEALGWGASGGVHECEFCIKPFAARTFGRDVTSGTFGVPAGDQIFFCPEMIAHYVEEHAYLPPSEFIVALMACPVPGTAEYKTAAQPFANRFE